MMKMTSVMFIACPCPFIISPHLIAHKVSTCITHSILALSLYQIFTMQTKNDKKKFQNKNVSANALKLRNILLKSSWYYGKNTSSHKMYTQTENYWNEVI